MDPLTCVRFMERRCKATHIKSAARRDRLLLPAALAHALLTLLGAAGQRCALDRKLKKNTIKKRTMPLYNQGAYWYMAIPNMREERLVMDEHLCRGAA
jgi:hypothetical protein